MKRVLAVLLLLSACSVQPQPWMSQSHIPTTSTSQAPYPNLGLDGCCNP